MELFLDLKVGKVEKNGVNADAGIDVNVNVNANYGP
jgi:hypothetical protein